MTTLEFDVLERHVIVSAIGRAWRACCISCVFCVALLPSMALCDPVIAGSSADGDATLLALYEFPADLRSSFESLSKAAAATTIEKEDGMWLMYERPSNREAQSTVSYFTVHFPDTIDELTEPQPTTYGVISQFGAHRVHSELTRQVPDWCSTVSIDPNKLEYAYVEYLWLKPDALEVVGQFLAAQGEILRSMYGTESDGNLATEGFVSMVAPFQVMLVLFSSESSPDGASGRLNADLQTHGFGDEWNRLQDEIDARVSKREYLSGRYRADLSADW